MRKATIDEHKEIMGIFKTHIEWFPHIRNDYIERMILAGNCIYEDGVVITFLKYKKRGHMKQFDVPAGNVILHQIVNGNQFSGKGGQMLDKFFKFCAVDVWLNVRDDNMIARKFYEKHGMAYMGEAWTGNGLKLAIYKKEAFNPFLKLDK